MNLHTIQNKEQTEVTKSTQENNEHIPHETNNEENILFFENLLLKNPRVRYPQEGEIVEGEIVKIEKKTILVSIHNQFSGIILSKEIGNSVDIHSLKEGDKIEAMVLGDSVEEGLLLLSLKRANQIKSLSSLSSNYSSDKIITVRPTEANKGGLLVDIDGLKGFIPVSQLAPLHYPRVEGADPNKIYEHLTTLVGKEFKVKVINIDPEGKKIIFSEKAAIAHIRENALKNLKVGDVVEGIVSGILSYGFFVTFSGLEGLVHVSEIDRGHVGNPAKFAKVGQKVKVKVIGLEGEKISLSVKRLQENPWEILAKKYKIGDIIRATVSRISQFGAFVLLEGGVQGLIHLSEISHDVVKDVRDYVKVGQEIDVKIIHFEPEKKRIGLSLKALLPEPPKAQEEGMQEHTSGKEKETSSDEPQKKDIHYSKGEEFEDLEELYKHIQSQ